MVLRVSLIKKRGICVNMKLIKIAAIGMIAVGSLSISSSSFAEMENVTKNEVQAAPSSFPDVPG